MLSESLRTWTAAKCGAFFDARGWTYCAGVTVEKDGVVKCRGERDEDFVDIEVAQYSSVEGAESYEAYNREKDGRLCRRFGSLVLTITQTSRVDAERLRDAYVATGRFDVESLTRTLVNDGWTVLEPKPRLPKTREAFKQCAEGRSHASLELDDEAEDSYDERVYSFGVGRWRQGTNCIYAIVVDVDAAAWWLKELEDAAP